ncbi:MAG: cob(I)yrinic acid a,c-diamide adenosyltransferase [Synechococcus sp.]|uniref:cob(I)yrinic acid a,c-diamide adenosyltransferase n=1 Tax=unclassified Synechococcus TaxID=2626047 RepID=UPI001646D4E4|nr:MULTISPECIES: cob(I)yrinic acid a,c-diamide adenosyltransferase [unclassified Synechococcus]MCH9773235.1 cob(I)yrinic acid a,c-diamide adenosyltransferase [Cyanobacteriota bacterium]MDB4336034.1 cob(I)yrinic acid a,c-diamide adenosyltransferase [Synechococcus sp. AH-603-M21]MDC0250937.1 cob(I)yrinic acid a,c-diamide adenosyltransferase [Synechococcus sp. AH-551-P21]MDC0261516.1 cob(I)yrinic acid a,c-diamide adenosyltransferase [Synechococcus sp. AH-551-N17]MDC0309992.1 cob(I)yrinic acid a,c
MTVSLSPTHHSRESRTVDHRTLEQAGLRRLPSVEVRPPLHLVAPEGQLQVHTASFRGSFSGVLSQALRTAGLGSNVLIAQFLKGGVGQGPQSSLTLCDRLRWLRPSVTECLSDPAASRDDEVKEAVQSVWEICKTHLLEGTLDQLVLDEIGLAIELGYLSHEDVLSVLEQRPSAMDVIVTGPAIPAEMMEMADQVTELRRGF